MSVSNLLLIPSNETESGGTVVPILVGKLPNKVLRRSMWRAPGWSRQGATRGRLPGSAFQSGRSAEVVRHAVRSCGEVTQLSEACRGPPSSFSPPLSERRRLQRRPVTSL